MNAFAIAVSAAARTKRLPFQGELLLGCLLSLPAPGEA
jgi:hypothetical protein